MNDSAEQAMPLEPVKPAPVVKFHGRAVSVVGYRCSVAEDHLLEHLNAKASKRWCTVACMARTMHQRPSPRTCKAVRANTSRLFQHLLKRGRLLVVEYGERGQTQAYKLYTGEAGVEEQCLSGYLERMRRRGLITQENVAMVEQLKEQADTQQPH